MKKLLLFAFTALMISGTTIAQSVKQEEKKDLRTDLQIKRAHQKAMADDAAHLRLRKASEQNEAANAARDKQHATAKDLRDRGVKHPVKAVRKQLHKEHDAADAKKG